MKKAIDKNLLDNLCKFENKTGYFGNGVSYVYTAPTGNCQLFVFGQFASLMNSLILNGEEMSNQTVYIPNRRKGSKEIKLNVKYYYNDRTKRYVYDDKAFVAIMKSMQTKTNKNLMLIDIHNWKQYTDFVNKFFKGYIVSKQLYTSTNGSKMVIYLLNMQCIRNYK